MMFQVRFTLALLVVSGLAGSLLEAVAQTSAGSSTAPTQNLFPQNTQGSSQVASPGFGVPATTATAQTTPGLVPTPSGISPSTTTTFFSPVGRGLPGMPGGPQLGAPGGAIDPSSSYMSPPLIGPLFCDPALNVSC